MTFQWSTHADRAKQHYLLYSAIKKGARVALGFSVLSGYLLFHTIQQASGHLHHHVMTKPYVTFFTISLAATAAGYGLCGIAKNRFFHHYNYAAQANNARLVIPGLTPSQHQSIGRMSR